MFRNYRVKFVAAASKTEEAKRGLNFGQTFHCTFSSISLKRTNCSVLEEAGFSISAANSVAVSFPSSDPAGRFMLPAAKNIVSPQTVTGVNQPHRSVRRDASAFRPSRANNCRAIRSDGGRGCHECMSFIIKFFPA
jgi:hypothetical protein